MLSLQALRKIHETFTAEDLKYVELLPQHEGALAYKAQAGRALEHQERIHAADAVAREHDLRDVVLPQLTIECTCGYLVNMVDGSIQLISPCNASERWPRGLRIHAEGTFRDASDLRGFIERTTATQMVEHLAQDDRLAFRDDLAYQKVDDGFVLTSLFTRHAMRGPSHAVRLGELIAQGTKTVGEVIAELVQAGAPVLEVVSSLDRLHRKGLIEDATCDSTTT